MNTIAQQLALIRRNFDPKSSATRLRLLGAARRATSEDPAALHEELLNACAYPDSPAHLKAAEHALSSVVRTATARRDEFENSGLPGTAIVTTYSHDLIQWLCERDRRSVDIDWSDRKMVERIDAALPLLCHNTEIDGLAATSVSTKEWLQIAAKHRTPLTWLWTAYANLDLSLPMRDRLFDSLELGVRWRVPRSSSRTYCRFPPRPAFYQSEPLLRNADLQALFRQRPPRCRRLGRNVAVKMIELARDTLAVRVRETDPVTYANQDEVELFSLDRGIDVALFGMSRARRLPIESYFGYVAARNRVPIAYGGAWVFFHRCEIGVNLFETFRSGESAHIFAQILRVYRHHYGVKVFEVDPYQFGANNDEAIQSGAFWFYYRLGFRPRDRALRQLADREAARLAANPGSRTPERMLRRLAGGPIVLCTEVGEPPPAAQLTRIVREAAPDLRALSLQVTRRGIANSSAVRRSEPPARENHGPAYWYAQLAPLLRLIPDFDRWPDKEKKAVVAALRAKGGVRERDYALALAGRSRLRAALSHAAR